VPYGVGEKKRESAEEDHWGERTKSVNMLVLGVSWAEGLLYDKKHREILTHLPTKGKKGEVEKPERESGKTKSPW